jgi:hypothetical protein
LICTPSHHRPRPQPRWDEHMLNRSDYTR